MSDWQPIETMPTGAEQHGFRRGERVLVWVADGGDDGTRRGCCAFGYGYRSENGAVVPKAEGYNGEWHITRWMPLPDPPKP